MVSSPEICETADGRIGARSAAWRRAALEHTSTSRDFFPEQGTPKYGVKQAAPGNYRTRRFAHRSVGRLFIRLKCRQT
jgi:hypothetical protein